MDGWRSGAPRRRHLVYIESIMAEHMDEVLFTAPATVERRSNDGTRDDAADATNETMELSEQATENADTRRGGRRRDRRKKPQAHGTRHETRQERRYEGAGGRRRADAVMVAEKFREMKAI